MDTLTTTALCQRLTENIEHVIVGKRDAVERTLVALLADGHLLIEDIPGVGKTMLARSLALSIGGEFRRLQFTPDLMPGDVTGVSVFNQKTQEFDFRPGPVFANILLADEINRASPRTQSALLEAMEEHQVTEDGHTLPLPRLFMVIATENPLDYEGVYPLPESQLDRFLMRIDMGYPSLEDEKNIVRQQMLRHPVEELKPIASVEEILSARQVARACHVAEEVYNYTMAIISATREHESLYLGASPRGTLGLIRAAQALAVIRGRDFVSPDEIKELAPDVLSHRLLIASSVSTMTRVSRDIVTEITDELPAP